MSETNIEGTTELLIEFVAEKLDVPASSLRPDTAFDDLDLDSLVLLELAVLVRNRIGVTVSDLEMAEARTISGAAEIVASRRFPETVGADEIVAG